MVEATGVHEPGVGVVGVGGEVKELPLAVKRVLRVRRKD